MAITGKQLRGKASSVPSNTIYFKKPMEIFGDPSAPISGALALTLNLSNAKEGSEVLIIHQHTVEATYTFSPSGSFSNIATNYYTPSAINYIFLKYLGNNIVMKNVFAVSSTLVPISPYKVNPIIDEYLGSSRSFNAAAGGTSGTFAQIQHQRGVFVLDTGANTNGRERVGMANDTITLLVSGDTQVWESILNIPTASDATNTFLAIAGFNDSDTAIGNDVVAFEYQYNQNSGKWRTVYRDDGGTTNYNNTSVAAVSGTYQTLRIELISTTEARWYIDGTLVQSITSGLPVGRGGGFCVQIIKSAGTTARQINLDRQAYMVY